MYHSADKKRRIYWDDRDYYSFWENRDFAGSLFDSDEYSCRKNPLGKQQLKKQFLNFCNCERTKHRRP